MSLDTQKFIDMMREDHYRDGKWEIFNDALIAADAIIAGGAVLAAYNQDSMYINDVDIYIHASKTLKFVDDLDKSILNYRISYGNYIAPAYDQSFFRRNNILARFTLFQRYEWDNRSESRQPRVPDIDIIIIPDTIPILSVVKNFDLTFCEIWYDAATAKVSAVDPAGILAKTGMLKKDYVENMLVYLNRFTIKRVEKYVRKGFTISYDCDTHYTFVKKSKNVLSPEEWVVYKLYQFIVFGTIRHRTDKEKSLEIVCNHPLSKYTLSDFESILPALKTTMSSSMLRGVTDNKSLYLKILYYSEFYHVPRLPVKYLEYIQTVLGISLQNIQEYRPPRPVPAPARAPAPDRIKPIKPDVNTFDFSDVGDDFNEDTFTNTTGKDLIIQDDSVNILEYLSEAGTFLFVSKNPLIGAGFDVLCFEKNSIKYMIKDKNNWFYECIGPIRSDGTKSADVYGRDTYVKLPNDEATSYADRHRVGGTQNVFIPLVQLKKILKRNHKIYYIEFDKDITHSIGWKNSFGPSRHANWVSANHCQGASNIFVYTLKVCRDPVRCIKSLSEWGRPAATSEDDMYQDSLESDEDDDEDRDEQQAQQEEREQAEFEDQSEELARLQLEEVGDESDVLQPRRLFDEEEDEEERELDLEDDPRDYH